MQTSCYLIISGKKSPYGRRVNPNPIRMTKNKPPTQSDEVAIKVNIDLPDALFTKPAMEITLSAPEPQGVELSTEVQDQISEFIAEATGLKTVVRFEAAEGESA
jgi:hypothetical protein